MVADFEVVHSYGNINVMLGKRPKGEPIRNPTLFEMDKLEQAGSQVGVQLPPQLTIVTAIAKTPTAAITSAPARGFCAIHCLILRLLSLRDFFSIYLLRAGTGLRRITDHVRAGFGS
jgi:hypothetical protein